MKNPTSNQNIYAYKITIAGGGCCGGFVYLVFSLRARISIETYIFSQQNHLINDLHRRALKWTELCVRFFFCLLTRYILYTIQLPLYMNKIDI